MEVPASNATRAYPKSAAYFLFGIALDFILYRYLEASALCSLEARDRKVLLKCWTALSTDEHTIVWKVVEADFRLIGVALPLLFAHAVSLAFFASGLWIGHAPTELTWRTRC